MSSLDGFRTPASVAVVGASDDHAKWGYWLARGALGGRHRRAVYLVNSSSSTVQGETSYPNVTALPEVPELVVLCVPPRFIEGVVNESLARGVKAFLGITAGVTHEQRVGAAIRAAGARIVGPNSLGLYDASTELQLAWGNFTPGPLAIVSQSGQLGSEIAILGERAGLGVSRFISVGNQIDVNAAELLDDLIDHDATRIIALYLESFADGAHLVKTLSGLAEAGKQTIILTTGASEASQRLAQSHTGSLTSALDTVDAACRAAGAIRVSTPTELINLAHYLSVAPKPRGRRVAVVSDSGGQGGVAADVAASFGLSTPVFSTELQSRLAGILPPGRSVSNPVDLAGAGEADLNAYADLSQILLDSGEADAVVLSGYFGCYGVDTPPLRDVELAVIDRMGDMVQSSHLPLVVHSMSVGSPAIARMWEHGIPALPGIESAMNAIAHAAHLTVWPGRDIKVLDENPSVPARGYWAARDLLGELGITVPRGMLIESHKDLGLAATGLAFPLVLKAGWLEHKSEHGGVKLDLDSLAAVTAAYDDMHARLGEGEYVLEEQDRRPDAIEVLVGGRQDRDFGPLIVVGAGGTEAELHRDVCVELAPVDHSTAMSMIGRLKCLPLLEGWRGKPAVDMAA
ncbi:MAG: acetate--CoA ligase family protein, partial [Nocardioidaceae bacterium]